MINQCFGARCCSLAALAALASPSSLPTKLASSVLRHRRRRFLNLAAPKGAVSTVAVDAAKISRSRSILKMDDDTDFVSVRALVTTTIGTSSSGIAPPKTAVAACDPLKKSISVMTLNCWGLPYIAKDRKERFRAFTEAMLNNDWDIVVLQEVWSENDFKQIVTDTESAYRSSYYFYSGVIGSGVCVFTKGQIVATLMHRYSLNGYAHKVQHGDWFGGKVCGLAKIVYKGLLINLYATHIHASYHEKHDEYKPHRIVQAFELSQFIRFTSSPSTLSLAEGVDKLQRAEGNIDWLHPLTIVAGDFNMEAGDLGVELIRRLAGLVDSWDSFKRFAIVSQDTSTVHAETSDCFDNYYTAESLRSRLGQNSGKRIDYILFGQPAGFETPYKLRCTHAAASLNQIPNSSLCYSDHKGYVVQLTVEPRASIVIPTALHLGSQHVMSDSSLFDVSEVVKAQSMQNNDSSKLACSTNHIYGLDDPRRASVSATTRSISHDAGGLNDELIERAINIVEDGFRKVKRDSRFFIGFAVASFVCFITTFVVSGLVAYSTALQIVLAVVRVMLIGILLACMWIVMIMARIERNALRATRNTMLLMQGNMNPETKSIDEDSIILSPTISNLTNDAFASPTGDNNNNNFSSARHHSAKRSLSTSRVPLFRSSSNRKRKVHRNKSSGVVVDESGKPMNV